jgi:DNA-binding PadR family transcriptional regulator
MAGTQLSLFSAEILGLVGRRGAGAHDLLQSVKRMRVLAWAGESQYYSEPKRLAKLGYLEARQEPGRTHPRTVYYLTDAGLEALREYARTPVEFEPVKNELLIRLLITDLVGEDVTREMVGTLRTQIAELEQELDAAVERAPELEHRRKYLLIVYDYLRALLDLNLDFVDRIERELS